MSSIVVTRQGSRVTVTLDCGDLEFLYTGLKDLSYWIRHDDATKYDSPQAQEGLAQQNQDMADQLEQGYVDTIPVGTDMRDVLGGKI
jgi:hypothetical protein